MVAFFFKYSNYFINRVTWARHATDEAISLLRAMLAIKLHFL